MWRTEPRWLYLSALVPFPAHYMVFENMSSLEWVPGDSLTRRWELEASGKGWWTYNLLLTKPDGTIDPTKPTRVTEAQVIIRPSQNVWSSQDFLLTLSAISINPYCPSKASNVNFRLRKPPATLPPQQLQ
jgi:hypothetical protein